MARGGRARGGDAGGAPESSNKRCINWFGDEGGGMGGGVGGGGPWRAGKGGDGGGHLRAVQKVHWFPLFGSLKNLTTGLIWLVRGWGDGGRRGEVAHGGRARGEMGGSTREQCGSNKKCTGCPLKDDGGRRGEVAHGGRARGEMGGEGRWFPLFGVLTLVPGP